MTAKYEIYIQNGYTECKCEVNGFRSRGSIDGLKGQLLYNLRNGIVTEILGVTLIPEIIIESTEDIYNYFFKNSENNIISLTDYLCGIITVKRGIRDGHGWSSVIINGNECRFYNDGLKGGLPVSDEQVAAINKIIADIKYENH